jgi:hypothetical protein
VLCAIALVGAAVLLFPFVPTVFADGGRALSSLVGTTRPDRLARLALGDGPGTWVVAAFLPISAAIGFGLVRTDLRGPAARAAAGAGVGLLLSWLSAAGYLPTGLSNPPAYAALAGVSMATLVAFGLTSAIGSMRLESFGLRQVAVATLGIALGGGLLLQSLASMVGSWAIGGPERIPAAWAVVDGSAVGAFRVLWLGGDGGAGLPPPAGDPQRRLEAGPATVRYALTDRAGVSVLDLGRPLAGPGPDRADAALGEILSGTTRHGGALLAGFGVRFVVAEDAVLSREVRAALDAQLDLDALPAVGLAIYRNASAIPPAALLETTADDLEVLRASDLGTIATWRAVKSIPLETVRGGWDGPAGTGTVYLATEFDRDWLLRGSDGEPAVAFGWATRFTAESGPIAVRHEGGLAARIRSAVLLALWGAALWVTRKPVAR